MHTSTLSLRRSRREFLAAAAGAGVLSARQAPEQARRPNIVVILADDLGWGDPRCYNPESRIPTPHLDRLASQGMRFTDAHSPSAVCTPTRYGLLTGRYCWRTSLQRGVLNGESPCLIEKGRLTVAELLKRRGYRTGLVGKWHLGLGSGTKTDYSAPLRPGPLDFGFESFFGIPASLDMAPYVYVDGDRPARPATGVIAEKSGERGVFWRGGGIAEGFRHEDVLPELTSRARRFIRNHAETRRQEPFFLHLCLTSPHTPWLPDRKFAGKSGAGVYGDFVAMTDDAVGQVLAELRGTGLERETLVLMTSDNGADWSAADIAQWKHRANARWRGRKADIWEAGHRVPLIARWPGRIAARSVSPRLICLTDLLATLAELTGVNLPEDAGEDSFSFLPSMLQAPAAGAAREAIVLHSLNGHFAIRKGPWKLHLGLGSGGFTEPAEIRASAGEPAGELFNVADDPAESRNVYAWQPRIVAELTALLDQYRQYGRSR